jgi:DNA-binding response OmpR family regulator
MGGTVVVLDDHPPLCRIVLRALRAADFDAQVSLSADQVLDNIRTGRLYDVILIELEMRQTPALHFLQTVKALAPDQLPRILVMTDGLRSAEAQAATELTGLPAVRKPFQLPELLARVQAIVDRLGPVEP